MIFYIFTKSHIIDKLHVRYIATDKIFVETIFFPADSICPFHIKLSEKFWCQLT